MFSNDKNIETIGQLAKVIKHYIGLQTEFMKLDIIEKVVRLITAIALTLVLSLLFILTLIYLSFAAVYALQLSVGISLAFAIVAGSYFTIFILFILFRKQWLERPVVKFLASILLDK